MDTFCEKVSGLLKRQFGPAAIVQLRDEDGIIGTVTSPRFRRKDEWERITMIWNALEERLSTEEKLRIDIIVPVTPEEARGLGY